MGRILVGNRDKPESWGVGEGGDLRIRVVGLISMLRESFEGDVPCSSQNKARGLQHALQEELYQQRIIRVDVPCAQELQHALEKL